MKARIILNASTFYVFGLNLYFFTNKPKNKAGLLNGLGYFIRFNICQQGDKAFTPALLYYDLR